VYGRSGEKKEGEKRIIGEAGEQIKESREVQGRKKIKTSIAIPEVSTQTHRISANPKP
jgi:hypothetical protein